jgi:NAD(P)-dependent dehydrogenase (short-subunit alcohol dehydrogenase family)
MSPIEQIFAVRGKIALITGGYRRIGADSSLGLAEMGAKIVVAGTEGPEGAEFAKSLRDRGHDAYSATFDVISHAETQRMVDLVIERIGGLDILVNCV